MSAGGRGGRGAAFSTGNSSLISACDYSPRCRHVGGHSVLRSDSAPRSGIAQAHAPPERTTSGVDSVGVVELSKDGGGRRGCTPGATGHPHARIAAGGDGYGMQVVTVFQPPKLTVHLLCSMVNLEVSKLQADVVLRGGMRLSSEGSSVALATQKLPHPRSRSLQEWRCGLGRCREEPGAAHTAEITVY